MNKNLLLLIIVLFPLLAVGCGNYGPISKDYTHFIHNKIRMSAGLGELDVSDPIELSAQRHAEWMARNETMEHQKIPALKEAGAKDGCGWVAENIAYGQPTEDNVLQDWMDSPGHHKNIMNKVYDHAGIGFSRSKNGTPYWCVVFGGTGKNLQQRPQSYSTK